MNFQNKLIGVIACLSFANSIAQKKEIRDTMFFNREIPRNAISVSAGGETILYGVGYQRCFQYSKKFRNYIDVKASYVDAFFIPVSLYSEILEKKNKILVGFALGNQFNTDFDYIGIRDLKELLKTNKPLYTRPDFFYVPYCSLKAGYKRYFTTHHAISFEAMIISYPIFKPVDASWSRAKLGLAYQPFASITYYYQFQKSKK